MSKVEGHHGAVWLARMYAKDAPEEELTELSVVEEGDEKVSGTVYLDAKAVDDLIKDLERLRPERDTYYELHIYGGEGIEETKDEFDTKEEAIEEAERRSSDDTTEWSKAVSKDADVLSSIRMFDYNNGHGAVIHRINERFRQ